MGYLAQLKQLWLYGAIWGKSYMLLGWTMMNHLQGAAQFRQCVGKFQDAQLILDVLELLVIETREILSDIIHGLQAHDLSHFTTWWHFDIAMGYPQVRWMISSGKAESKVEALLEVAPRPGTPPFLAWSMDPIGSNLIILSPQNFESGLGHF